MMCNKKRLTILTLGAFLLTGVHGANAFSSMTRTITDYCSNNGNDLLPAYAADSCAACHDDNQAKAAYDAGDYGFFCPTIVVTPTCTDGDEDGYFVEGESCGTLADFNDDSAAAHPGASEDCSDGIDNDGNGMVDATDPNAVNCPVACTDIDMDGYAVEGGSCGAIDCNDNDASINPGAVENCSDALDNNCNGLVDVADANAVACPLECTDSDGDGYSIEGGSCGAVDCDDSNADINPGALEICSDGIDNNCNGLADSGDGVCQNNDGGSDRSDKPWWRSKGKRHHHHKKACENKDSSDDNSSDDDDHEEDEDDEDDDRYENEDHDEDDDRDRDRKSRKSRD
ncbi:MAG: putative metal-binding motif-containing protein [Candidatus Thiodiazotropha endolucinida]